MLENADLTSIPVELTGDMAGVPWALVRKLLKECERSWGTRLFILQGEDSAS